MTTASVSGDFSAASARDTDFAASGKVVSKFAPVTSHEMDANAIQQVRHGVPRRFDDAADRGPAIGAAPGMSPLKV